MNGLHVALIVLAFLILLGAVATGFRSDPIHRYSAALTALGLAVYMLDMVLVAARVY